MKHRPELHRRTTAAAVAAGAVAASLVSAPTAQATCVSVFGLGGNPDCTSTILSSAIAIGPGATAHASGFFGSAMAFGANSTALQSDAFTFGITAGQNSSAEGAGLFGIAINFGSGGQAITQGTGRLGNIGLNIAFNAPMGTTTPSSSVAAGFGNIATNVVGDGSTATALGTVNIAMNTFGRGNSVIADNQTRPLLLPIPQNVAFNMLGSGNTVAAGPGPFAVAGSILQNGATVTKVGPGFNINGLRVGGAAATPGTRPGNVPPASPNASLSAATKNRASAAASIVKASGTRGSHH